MRPCSEFAFESWLGASEMQNVSAGFIRAPRSAVCCGTPRRCRETSSCALLVVASRRRIAAPHWHRTNGG
jgi:hypothetical protein